MDKVKAKLAKAFAHSKRSEACSWGQPPNLPSAHKLVHIGHSGRVKSSGKTVISGYPFRVAVLRFHKLGGALSHETVTVDKAELARRFAKEMNAVASRGAAPTAPRG